ncbi:hypothetical protein V8F33_009782 [Rhypophila sp. PSN 637]
MLSSGFELVLLSFVARSLPFEFCPFSCTLVFACVAFRRKLRTLQWFIREQLRACPVTKTCSVGLRMWMRRVLRPP